MGDNEIILWGMKPAARLKNAAAVVFGYVALASLLWIAFEGDLNLMVGVLVFGPALLFILWLILHDEGDDWKRNGGPHIP